MKKSDFGSYQFGRETMALSEGKVDSSKKTKYTPAKTAKKINDE